MVDNLAYSYLKLLETIGQVYIIKKAANYSRIIAEPRGSRKGNKGQSAIPSLGGDSLSLNVKVTPRQDGAVITVDGLEITITVKPSAPAPPRIIVETVRARLAEHMKEVSVTEEEEGIVVRPTGFLGRDKFSSIAAIVRELGGNYVSAGRESRFVIPKG